MKYIYRDKHGNHIHNGDLLRHDGGEVEVVVATTDADGDEGLGFGCNAFEAYPLHQFDLSEWEIIKEEEE